MHIFDRVPTDLEHIELTFPNYQQLDVIFHLIVSFVPFGTFYVTLNSGFLTFLCSKDKIQSTKPKDVQ